MRMLFYASHRHMYNVVHVIVVQTQDELLYTCMCIKNIYSVVFRFSCALSFAPKSFHFVQTNYVFLV